MISTQTTKNLTAISAGSMETKINTPQTMDMSILLGAGDLFNIVPRREDNADEANGREEADIIYDNGATGKVPFTFAKLKPHEAAILLAYGLGTCTTVAAGNGYEHTMTPIAGGVDLDRDVPTFTASQRLGLTLQKQRFASCAVNSFEFAFAADAWVKGSGEILSTGFREKTVEEVTISALDNVAALTVPVAVHGSDAAERLDNVQRVRALMNGAWQPVTVTAVGGAGFDELTITALGGTGDTVEYRVLYAAIEPAWATFPARVLESSLRVSEMCLTLGGAWNGTEFIGGRSIGGTEFDSCTCKLSNNLSVPFTPCAGGAVAGAVERSARTQSISLSRKIRDWLLQQQMEDNEYFGLHIICEGKEFDTGHKYTVELIYPRLGILTADLSDRNGKVAEAGDLKVLQDLTYGSVIGKVKNKVAGFAQ